MKTIKTADLTGAALDWAVAKCESIPTNTLNTRTGAVYSLHHGGVYSPSTTWHQGGPIIERERISLCDNCPTGFKASKRNGVLSIGSVGPTPLIAAMRCHVTSHLGPEVEVPEELL